MTILQKTLDNNTLQCKGSALQGHLINQVSFVRVAQRNLKYVYLHEPLAKMVAFCVVKESVKLLL